METKERALCLVLAGSAEGMGWGTEEILDMLMRLLVLASLPLRLLEMGRWVGATGVSNGLVDGAMGGARAEGEVGWGSGGSTGRLVRGSLEEGVAPPKETEG